MTIAPVVVSFNRGNLFLDQCLEALSKQNFRPDEIVIVDNGAMDGADEAVRERFSTLSLIETGRNLGGAGGFAGGVEMLMARGRGFAWIMDDEETPQPQVLTKLVKAEVKVPDRFQFLTPTVIFKNGSLSLGNVPMITRDLVRQDSDQLLGAFAVDNETFLGVLIYLRHATRTRLSIADFFIWVDDSGYTRRFSRSVTRLMVTSSRIVHPDNKNNSQDRGEQYFHILGDNLWFDRAEGHQRCCVTHIFLDLLAHSFKQGVCAKKKKTWLGSAARGFKQGLFRKPIHQMQGGLRKALPSDIAQISATRWVGARLGLSSLLNPISIT